MRLVDGCEAMRLGCPPLRSVSGAGEGDRAKRGGGGKPQTLAPSIAETQHAPTTMLRMVPLPRFAGEDTAVAGPIK